MPFIERFRETQAGIDGVDGAVSDGKDNSIRDEQARLRTLRLQPSHGTK